MRETWDLTRAVTPAAGSRRANSTTQPERTDVCLAAGFGDGLPKLKSRPHEVVRSTAVMTRESQQKSSFLPAYVSNLSP
jgi:hypothetical protein